MLDVANLLETILLITDAHTITNIFLFLIISTFVISLLLAAINKGEMFVAYTPTLLTSLGILGTFIGIVIGLLDFNPNDIDGSITLLLSGLKTAFITSLAGMALTILYKLLSAIPIFRQDSAEIENMDIEPKDILKAIKNHDQYLISIINANKNQEKHSLNISKLMLEQKQDFKVFINLVEKQNNHLVTLKNAISDDESSSLIGQFKSLRSDINENHQYQQNNFNEFSDKLWINLQEFSEMLSKSATEQVIKALKAVISDFNNNLMEQFGENFKALDDSVKKLVIWQVQYGKQLNDMINQYSEGVKAISNIESSVRNINKETENIPTTMANLKTIMDVNQHQIGELSRHLEAFKQLKDQAVRAIPDMQNHVERTVKNIASASDIASKNYRILLSNIENVQASTLKNTHDIQEKMQISMQALIDRQISEMNTLFGSLEEGSHALQTRTEGAGFV
jgi:hypothetical protein